MKKSFLISLLALILTSCNNVPSASPSVTPSVSPSVPSVSEVTPSPSVSESDITLLEESLIGLPNHSYDVDLINEDNKTLLIEVSDSSLVSVDVKSNTSINISLLKEGSGFVKVGLKEDNMKTISVECLDLKIINEETHLSVGDVLNITLSHNVNATFEVDNTDVAIINNKTVEALSSGEFTLTARYGRISVSKSFNVYPRSNIITDLSRENIFVKYHGRNVHLGSHVIMNNVGSGFEVSFYGTTLKANLSGWYGTWYGETRIAVLVDGAVNTEENVIVIDQSTNLHKYTLVDNLNEGLHTVKVVKITEALSSSLDFYGVETDGYFVPVNKEEKLKIEVYGDSISAGYGNLRGSAPDGTNATIQDGMQTYATYTARALNADINVQARSGIGLYTSGNIDDNYQVNTGYRYVNYDKEYRWNFDNYTPDIVIINLGTNDHWNPSVFNETTYINKYLELIDNLISNYGEDTAFIFASGLMEQKVDDYVQQVYNQVKNSYDNSFHTIKFNQCAAGHPIKEEHKVASEALVELITDNNLNVIHTKETPMPEIGEITGKSVDITIDVSICDDYPSYAPIYMEAFGEETLVYSSEEYNNYPQGKTINKTVNEGDYEVRFYSYVNGVKNYEINNKPHILQVRENNFDFDLMVNTMVIADDPNPDADTFGWNMSSKLYEGSFNATDASTVSMTNNNWMAGFVTRPAIYTDNYTVSATIRAENFTVNNNDYLGLMPFYLDDLNCIWCYVGLNSDNTTLRTIGLYGYINGKETAYYDCWSFQGLTLPYDTGFELKVTRAGENFSVECLGRTEMKTISGLTGASKRIGVQSVTAGTVYYSNFKQINSFGWLQSDCLFSQTNTPISSDSISINNNNNWMAGFALKSSQIKDNYTVSATIFSAEDNYLESNDVQLAIVPYYKDAINFVCVYLQWNASKTLKSIGMTGKINGVDLEWNDFWAFKECPTSLTQGSDIEVARSGASITVKFNNITETKQITSLAGLDNAFAGVWAHNAVGTFSNYKVEAN